MSSSSAPAMPVARRPWLRRAWGCGRRSITMNLDLIAQMSCNPAIGGIAKGHLVREVDALGGIMGEVADAVGIQFRLLNTSRGPAVWSPRAQCDKQQYRVKMREVLEAQPGLFIKQAEVVDLLIDAAPDGHASRAWAEAARWRTVDAGAVVITTGTFLNGLIHCGEEQYPAGRSGEPPSVLLGEALKRLGLRGCRLKTGTPPRLDGRTIDWARFEEQPGDADPTPFSFRTKKIAAAPGLLPHCVHHAGDAAHHPRECLAFAHVLGTDRGHRAALLPVDRRQGRQVPGQGAAPVLPRARRPEHARGLRQRHVHLAADGSAVADGALHSRAGKCRDAAARLRHRIRRHRPDRA